MEPQKLEEPCKNGTSSARQTMMKPEEEAARRFLTMKPLER